MFVYIYVYMFLIQIKELQIYRETKYISLINVWHTSKESES